jgi:hypothetical protein
MMRNNWLPGLLRAEPSLTRARLLAIAKGSPKGRWMIETLFQRRADDLDEDMLRFVLRAFEVELRDKLDADNDPDAFWAHFPLELLGNITRPELLSILRAEAGGELERLIVSIACKRLNANSNWRDHVLDDACRVLILIGGEGISELLKNELASEHYWIRHRALRWAFVRRDMEIVALLSEIAHRPFARDADGRPEPNAYQEFYDAIVALAALGEDESLVSAIWSNVAPEIPVELARLRAHCDVMSGSTIARAAETLENISASDAEVKVALAIAWMSGEAALIPKVRGALGRAEPESDVAGYAAMALRELGDVSDDFL